MTTVNSDEVNVLYGKTVDQLLEILGAQTLGLTTPPTRIADAISQGAYAPKQVPALGLWEDCHELLACGKNFLKRWGDEFAIAVCGNDELYEKERQFGLDQTQLLVAAIAGAIGTQVTALAPFTGLLTVLGVIIAKTGVTAFCKQFLETEGACKVKARQ